MVTDLHRILLSTLMNNKQICEGTVKSKQYNMQKKISLLRRLQAQTLPDATPPVGKINAFSKMAITFEPLMVF